MATRTITATVTTTTERPLKLQELGNLIKNYWESQPNDLQPWNNIGAIFELSMRSWLHRSQQVSATDEEIFEAHKLFLEELAKTKPEIPFLEIRRVDHDKPELRVIFTVALPVTSKPKTKKDDFSLGMSAETIITTF